MNETLRLLRRYDISLNERLGQHLLVDARALDRLTDAVIPRSNVIEIGSGPGNLTSRIATKASSVIGIEIDQRYRPILDRLKARHPNIRTIYGDALKIDYEKLVRSHQDATWQIVANLPYHISEPFLEKMVLLKVDSIILTIGDNLARLMRVRDPRSSDYSKLSLLSNTFFHVKYLGRLPKAAFYPPPRIDSVMVQLTPRDNYEYGSPGMAILKQLATPKNKGLTVEKAIVNAMSRLQSGSTKNLGKEHRHRAERRDLNRYLINLRHSYSSPVGAEDIRRKRERFGVTASDSLGLPKTILSKPLFALNNSEIRTLAMALQDNFGE